MDTQITSKKKILRDFLASAIKDNVAKVIDLTIHIAMVSAY